MKVKVTPFLIMMRCLYRYVSDANPKYVIRVALFKH